MKSILQIFSLFLFLLSTGACTGRLHVFPTLVASPALATFPVLPTASPVSHSTPTRPPAVTAIPIITPTRIASATPTPTATPDFCSPARWEESGVYVLSADLFDALRPGDPRTFDRILAKKHPAWAEFRQKVHGEVRTAGVIFHEVSAGQVWGTGVNPAVILVTYGVAYDWALPPDGDLASRVNAIRAALYQADLNWFLSRVDRTRYPRITNGPTYALYRFFHGDLSKLEAWCYTFVEVYGIWPVETSTNGE